MTKKNAFLPISKKGMNICCSPAVEDPGKECDKDGGGEVDDGRQTPRPGTRHVDDDDDDDDDGDVDDGRQTSGPGTRQPKIS